MPSTFLSSDGRTTRRGVLAGFGTGIAGSLAGCSGRLPGTGPDELATETEVEDDQDPRVVWRYPPREGETDGIGYAAVEAKYATRSGDDASPVRLTFNSTVGGIASSEPYEGYHQDWFRFRIWPPSSYEGRLAHEVRVEPPGQWEGFSAYYDVDAAVRRTTVELRDLGRQGTIEIPAVFDPTGNPLPDRLHCSFTVQASRSGHFGNAVRVSDRDDLPLEQFR